MGIKKEPFSDKPIRWINIRQALIGILTLILGGCFYLVDRPPESAWFVNHFLSSISLYGKYPPIFGTLGGMFPEFAHVFGFILLTGALFHDKPKCYPTISLVWMIINLLFELGQKFGREIAVWLSEKQVDIPGLSAIATYFHRGTFDPMDIATIIAGSVMAYATLLLTKNRH